MLEPTTPARSGDCPGAGVRRLRQRPAARPAGLVLAPLLVLLAPQAGSVRLRRGAAPAAGGARMLNAPDQKRVEIFGITSNLCARLLNLDVSWPRDWP